MYIPTHSLNTSKSMKFMLFLGVLLTLTGIQNDSCFRVLVTSPAELLRTALVTLQGSRTLSLPHSGRSPQETIRTPSDPQETRKINETSLLRLGTGPELTFLTTPSTKLNGGEGEFGGGSREKAHPELRPLAAGIPSAGSLCCQKQYL